MPNKRPGVDAGWRVLFAFQCLCPRATQAERSAAPNANHNPNSKLNMPQIIALILFACVIAITVNGLKLMGELVRAQERVADALETVARKLEGGGKP